MVAGVTSSLGGGGAAALHQAVCCAVQSCKKTKCADVCVRTGKAPNALPLDDVLTNLGINAAAAGIFAFLFSRDWKVRALGALLRGTGLGGTACVPGAAHGDGWLGGQGGTGFPSGVWPMRLPPSLLCTCVGQALDAGCGLDVLSCSCRQLHAGC